MTLKDSLFACIIIFVWGLNFVVLAIGLKEVPPLLLGGLRFLVVAGLGCLLIKRPKVPIKWWFLYAIPIGFLQFVFLFIAMAKGMPAGLASLILQSQALFTLLFSSVLLKETVRIHHILALCLASVGLGIIAIKTQSENMTFFGFILTLFAAISWAVGNISSRKMSELGYPVNINLVIWSSWIPPIPFFVLSYYLEGSEVIHSASVSYTHLTLPTIYSV